MSDEPLFKVTRGTPTPEELAALVGVLTVRLRPTPTAPGRATSSHWTRSARPGPLPAGPGAWRASGLPR
ncbi:acyl-CoA carboxylase epsilon subunit-like protein [Asanoa ferruginea]|uniref:Acyl-CoA carboxylase epsilon subunit-like protein n=1 Tax=Asanoa ferruginea TaxID=53367 RepID=A0A3D9ZM74_9ACTN|nr:acyl-CoA carboxylase subunit epsilon [Asanoa ferruginea]REF97033.1 acyl-CoA carboxylase epsilon subunit-like protein [Asanoa ferruginea]